MSWHVHVICMCLLSPSLAFNTYVAKFPNSLIPGIPLSVRVNILHSSSDTLVTTNLVHASNDSIISSNSSSFHSGEHGSIQLQVPETLIQSVYKVVVSGSGGLTFTNESSINYKGNSVNIYIQTDKTRYSAGQEVKYRVIALLPNLMGVSANVTVTIFDGKDNKIQIVGPQETKDGVVKGVLKLSEEPVFGDWRISASVKEIHVSKTKQFVVKPYVLPRFAVDLELPSVIRETDSSIIANVTAMFTFNKPVLGNVTIQIYKVADLTLHKEYSKQIYGQVSFNIPMLEMRSVFSYLQNDFNIRALVTDNATALTMATEKKLNILNDLPRIVITKADNRDYFVPGIDHYVTIFVGKREKIDGKYVTYSTPGVVNVSTEITTAENKSCDWNNPPEYWDIKRLQLPSFVLSFYETGLVAFKVPVPQLAQKIELSIKYLNTAETIILRAISYNQLTMLRLYPSKAEAKVGDVVTFSLGSTITLTGNLSVEVYSLGIFLEAHVIPILNESFSITIKPEMVPKVYIVATFITKDGQMLSDDVSLYVEGSPFRSNVSIAFDKTLLKPGETIHFQLAAEPNSTVYVLSEDERNILLGSENDVYFSEIVDDLKAQTTNANTFGSGRKRRNSETTRQKRSSVLSVRQRILGNSVRSFLFPLNGKIQKRYTGRIGDIDDVYSEGGIIVLSDTAMYLNDYPAGLPVDDANVQTSCLMPTTPYSDHARRGPDSKQQYPIPGLNSKDKSLLPGSDSKQQSSLPESDSKQQSSLPESDSKQQSSLPDPIALVTLFRSKFPETWNWNDYTIGSSGRLNVDMRVPDSITSWLTSVFASDTNTGFAITPTKSKITVQKDLFITMDLPSSLVFGEEYLLQVSVFNYLTIPGLQQVYIQVNITEQSGSQIIPAAVNVQQGQGHSTYVHVTPTGIGRMTVQVLAKAGAMFQTIATDGIERVVTVTPSGVPNESNQQHLIFLTTSPTTWRFNKSIQLTDPPNMVSGTKSSKMRITGNVMVPSINGLQNLIRMPYGCGEQTMLNFAPDIYITKYLKTVGKLTSEIEKKSIDVLTSGLQRELNYQHKDGSFSAFGDSDNSGSSWLTAFVLKCFHQADGLINIDEGITSKAMAWLLAKQNPDGSFYEPGRVIHTQMQAGTSSGIKLTSFILVSVLENKNVKGDSAKLSHAICHGKTYLESQLQYVNDMYTLAMMCYALAMSDSCQKTSCFTKMKQLSVIEDDKRHWMAGTVVNFEKRSFDPTLATRAPSADIETTSYCLLTYIKMDKASDAFQIMKWLVTQRNPNGGYESTQDTVVSLQALSEYSSISEIHAASEPIYGVDIVVKGESYNHAYKMSVVNKDVVHEFKLPKDLNSFNIEASGDGIALLEVTMSYYITALPNDNHISVTQTISKESLNSLTVRPCFRWHGHVASGMIVMQVEMPTGFVADHDVYNNQPTVKKHETKGRNIVLYFDGVDVNQEVCVNVKTDRSDPVVKSQACHITVVDYYEPTHQAMTTYESGILKRSNICDVCPLCNICTGASEPGQIDGK